MRVQLQFSGGAELLFDGVREHVVDLPEEQQKSGWTLQNLLPWIKNNLLKQRSELLIQVNYQTHKHARQFRVLFLFHVMSFLLLVLIWAVRCGFTWSVC